MNAEDVRVGMELEAMELAGLIEEAATGTRMDAPAPDAPDLGKGRWTPEEADFARRRAFAALLRSSRGGILGVLAGIQSERELDEARRTHRRDADIIGGREPADPLAEARARTDDNLRRAFGGDA